MKPINEMTLAECLEYLLSKNSLMDGRLVNMAARRISDLTRWIPVEERLPTKEDSDWNGMVAWKHQVMYGGVSFHPWNESPEWHGKNIRTHWKRIENL